MVLLLLLYFTAQHSSASPPSAQFPAVQMGSMLQAVVPTTGTGKVLQVTTPCGESISIPNNADPGTLIKVKIPDEFHIKSWSVDTRSDKISSEVAQMSTRKMKSALAQLGIRLRGPVEKDELREALVNARLRAPPIEPATIEATSIDSAGAAMYVRVPDGLIPGQSFVAFGFGKRLDIQVPHGAGGGAVMSLPRSVVVAGTKLVEMEMPPTESSKSKSKKKSTRKRNMR